MTTPIDNLVVTGHTLTFEAWIPQEKRAKMTRAAIRRVKLGAAIIKELLYAAGVNAHFHKMIPLTDARCQTWEMVWSPALDADDKRKPEEVPLKTLRISQSAEVDHGCGLDPVSSSRLPPIAASGGFTSTPATGVYVFLDVCSKYLPDATEFVPGNAGFVLVHLANSDDITEDHKVDLCNFLSAVTVPKGRTTVLLASDRVLSALGFPLTEERSFESFSDDCVRELQGTHEGPTKNLRGELEKFDHVIVRHNAFSAVHRSGKGNHKPEWRLHYFVGTKHTFSSHPGYLRGLNDLLGASVVAHAFRKVVDDSVITDGIANGLKRCSDFDASGYFDMTGAAQLFDLDRPVEIMKKVPTDGWISTVDIPPADVPHRPAAWSFLDLHLRQERWRTPAIPTKDGTFVAKWRAAKLGVEIVLKGLATVQKDEREIARGKKIRLPVVRFGKLQIIDRAAFEDVYEIRAAMQKYLRSYATEPRPLCLAMFGAPGGGKTFAVKELAASLGNPVLEPLKSEINVSQYEKAEDLAWVFKEIRDISLRGKVPLVFFDEFDSTKDGHPFGWQQTFLAPMQDGKFGRPPNQIEYRRGIFVFVGGVNHSFDGITGRARNRGFIEAKGPDFVSRLARHLNVLGMAQDDPGSDDFTFVVRRAVLLRSLLVEQPGLLRANDQLSVDEDLAAALLTVPAFRHGVRSLEAIVRTSRLHADRPRFHWATLPPDSQLDMHVDVASLYQAREEWGKKPTTLEDIS